MLAFMHAQQCFTCGWVILLLAESDSVTLAGVVTLTAISSHCVDHKDM